MTAAVVGAAVLLLVGEHAHMHQHIIDHQRLAQHLLGLKPQLAAQPHGPALSPAHPGRGSNENTNGLLHQFFPKGMDFSTVDQRDLDIALELLNNRPRKCLNYRAPADIFWCQSVRYASGYNLGFVKPK